MPAGSAESYGKFAAYTVRDRTQPGRLWSTVDHIAEREG
jgi:hypothetical protein